MPKIDGIFTPVAGAQQLRMELVLSKFSVFSFLFFLFFFFVHFGSSGTSQFREPDISLKHELK